MNYSKHTKLQTTTWLRGLFLMVLVLITSLGVNAQCDNTFAGGQFGSVTAPLSGTANISTCSYLSEFSVLNSVAAATTYQCAITTAPGGYITIREGNSQGPVIAFGASPLTWSSTVAGTYYAHWNVDAACGLASGCVNTEMTYIGPASSCSGTPTAGVTTANGTATANGACVGQPLNLDVTGATNAGGLTYQWSYSANSGGPYTPIAGATDATYTFTYSATDAGFYVRDITCAPNTTTSVEVAVTTNAPIACYCIPTTTNGCTAGDHITNVNFASLASPINNATGNCISGGSYSNYLTSVPAAQVSQGDMVPITVNVNNGGTEYAGAWIDYNQDGNFDATEFISLTDADGFAPWIYTGTANIPFTSTLGTTRLRVRSSYFTVIAPNSACATYSYGETEDYTINISASTNCTGTPNPGNTVASATSACPGTTVTLSLQNPTIGSGVSYEWYEGSTIIAGATNPTYATVVSNNTYSCNVTCGSNTTGSTPVTLSVNPFISCYCSTNLHSFSTPCITQIDFNSLSNATGSTCALPAYTAYPASTATTVVYTGSTYTLTRQASGTFAWTGVWIDYDQSGTFDASEYTLLSNSATATLSDAVSITIPLTAATGLTGMRIRQRTVDMTALDACTPNFGSGETEDYIINIQVPSPCVGTPAPGNTIASATSACPGQTVNLSLQFFTPGSNVTYQWVNNAGQIPGATNQTYAAAPGDDYLCIVRCGSDSALSSLITINTNPFSSCYCNTNLGGSCGTQSINSVAIATTTLNNLANGCGPTPYVQWPATGSTTGLLYTGFSYDITVGTGNNGNPAQIAMWIDYDQSGTFDSTEFNLIAASSPSGGTSTFNFTVPATALSGQTGMRIRSEYEFWPAFTGTSACMTTTWGEIEDYTIDIQIPSPCSGTPLPGNTVASATTVCNGDIVNFSLQFFTPGTGVTYQWYEDSLPIPGATNATYSQAITQPLDYNCVVKCGMDSTSSTIITMTINPPSACYCEPIYVTGKTDGDLISNVEIAGTTLANNSGTSPVNPAYTYFTTQPSGLPLNQTAEMQAGGTYTVNVTYGSFGSQQCAVWIDYNDDGNFSTPSERVGFTTSNSVGSFATVSFPISLNCNPPLGVHRMRVRNVFFTNGVDIDPCASYFYGETEDYDVTITTALPCPQPTNLSATAITTTDATLGWTAGCVETLWDVHVGLAGSGVPVGIPSHPGVTNPVTVTTLSASTAYEYYVRADCGGVNGQSAWSGPFTFSSACVPVVGSSFANPILVGVAPCSTNPYTNTQTNSLANCFTNSYTGLNNQSSPDVWYQFTLTAADSVAIGHCGSGFDTYIHLLDNLGNEIDNNDDNGDLCTGSAASLKVLLAPGTYYVVSEGFGGNTGAITTTISTNTPCVSNTTLNLTCLIEGYFDGVSGMVAVLANQGDPNAPLNATDSIDVSLKDELTYTTVATVKAQLNQDGTCTATFSGAYLGNYYIAVQHRNAIETWSANPVSFASSSASFNFTTASSQAYNGNQREVAPGVWAFFTGDIIKDANEAVELSDVAQLESDNLAFAFGLQASDINGDGDVNLSDFPLVEANVNAFIFSNHP